MSWALGDNVQFGWELNQRSNVRECARVLEKRHSVAFVVDFGDDATLVDVDGDVPVAKSDGG